MFKKIAVFLGITFVSLSSTECLNKIQLIEIKDKTKLIATSISLNFNLKLNFFTTEVVNKVNALHFEFSSNRNSSIDHARKQIIEIVELIFFKINCDNKNENYLNRFPISEKDVYVWIDYKGNPTDRMSFRRVMLIDGTIFFMPAEGAKELKKESFEEAKSIVLKSSPQR